VETACCSRHIDGVGTDALVRACDDGKTASGPEGLIDAEAHDVLVENNKTKYKKRWHGGKLGQTMVDSCYCLDQVVPERMSQV